jgi:hypothetical protein
MNYVCASLCVRLKEAAGHSNNSLESGARLLAPWLWGHPVVFLCTHTFTCPGGSAAAAGPGRSKYTRKWQERRRESESLHSQFLHTWQLKDTMIVKSIINRAYTAYADIYCV